MSSRAMKKLLRDSNGPSPLKDLDRNSTSHSKNRRIAGSPDHDLDQSQVDGSESEEEDLTPKRPPARNLFALLDGNDNDEDSEEDKEPEEEAAPVQSSTSPAKKKSKKKKKSKNSAANANPFDALNDADDNNAHSEEPAASAVAQGATASAASKSKNKKKKKGKAVEKSMEDMTVEEFEKSLQQMNAQLGSLQTGDEAQQRLTQRIPTKQLLSIDSRFLDADAEMKRMFGARVVNSEIRDRRYAKVAKKALLAQPRNTWPVRKASGLSMELVDSSVKDQVDSGESISLFNIVHSEAYQRTQLKFLTAVASYDPNNLVALLRESPFHIDSLLQLSEVSKHNGDHALAGEFIEQALFAFEKSFHSLFNISSGTVRIDYNRVTCRSFFLALHRHIQFLGRRGCWRTALEFNKLLLSLDPWKDELGALLSIDFYALKAQEYVYLQRLYESFKELYGLDKLPNFAYSIALVQFHLESQQQGKKQSNETDNKHEKSSKLLQRAILLFPTAVPMLADQGSFSVDAEISGEAAFYPTKDLPKALDLYIHLFVSRNFALWKEPEVIEWLKGNIRQCVQSRFQNANDPDVQEAKALLEAATAASHTTSWSTPGSTETFLSYTPDGMLDTSNEEIEELLAPPKNAKQSNKETPSSAMFNLRSRTSLRICRHVIVSEFTSGLARFLPAEIVKATTHMHDPLPPPEIENEYETRFANEQSQRQGTSLGLGGLLAGGTREAAQNMLEEVVRRLIDAGLPRIFAGAGGAEAVGTEAAGAGAGAGVGADEGNDIAAAAGGLNGTNADGLPEAQLRQIREAVEQLRGHDIQETGADLPGAFPRQTQPQEQATLPHQLQEQDAGATTSLDSQTQQGNEVAVPENETATQATGQVDPAAFAELAQRLQTARYNNQTEEVVALSAAVNAAMEHNSLMDLLPTEEGRIQFLSTLIQGLGVGRIQELQGFFGERIEGDEDGDFEDDDYEEGDYEEGDFEEGDYEDGEEEDEWEPYDPAAYE